MSILPVLLVLSGLLYEVYGAPMPDVQASGSVSGTIPPLITFKDGNVGVNFMGFKASAGLGGLLNGDATQGGLHAEAETPFGQRAGAGLGGRVGPEGRSVGGLYAGATAGGGVGAAAGIGGLTEEGGAAGGSFATASAGGASKTVVKEKVSGSGAAGASFSGSLNIGNVVPASQVELEIEEKPLPPPKKTYVERTVIPNYVEKTIQVPSYVEKTIRVPTVIEKRVKVPAPPTVIEKEVEVPEPVVPITSTKFVHKEVVPIEQNTRVITKTKTKIRRRPGWYFSKYYNYNSGEAPYYGGVAATGDAYAAPSYGGQYSATYTKSYNTDSNCNLGSCQ
ncbi:merozoite surface antigen 2 isoform X2 [Sitophilus oryzae]|uniref:Merozoite surface antigen 2 isoform X2 n=1 Tax=Sitophilus oryzae TaxID=7048 RepID=A0A6J2X3V0_SITOR|nr:merozoite surface antigen 2 isoform X2 [Sitophilus oryzae]